jgi:hypothetical protein
MYLSKSTIQNYEYASRDVHVPQKVGCGAGQGYRHFNLFRPQIHVEEPFSFLTILETYISCDRYTTSTEVKAIIQRPVSVPLGMCDEPPGI